MACGRSPESTSLGEIASQPTTLDANATVEEASTLMRRLAIRRVPIVDDGEPVGIVSLGDLATTLEPGSVLGEVSLAHANT